MERKVGNIGSIGSTVGAVSQDEEVTLHLQRMSADDAVILLPSRFLSRIRRATLVTQDGSRRVEGLFGGIGSGLRPFFRFRARMEEWQDAVKLEVTMSDGTRLRFSV
jgi:hypothetical protein